MTEVYSASVLMNLQGRMNIRDLRIFRRVLFGEALIKQSGTPDDFYFYTANVLLSFKVTDYVMNLPETFLYPHQITIFFYTSKGYYIGFNC